jgi:hypothetical protein
VAYDHGGVFPGYRTEMRFWPATGVAVAVMTNTSVARAIGAPLGAIAERLAAIAGAAEPPSRRAAEPPR